MYLVFDTSLDIECDRYHFSLVASSWCCWCAHAVFWLQLLYVNSYLVMKRWRLNEELIVQVYTYARSHSLALISLCSFVQFQSSQCVYVSLCSTANWRQFKHTCTHKHANMAVSGVWGKGLSEIKNECKTINATAETRRGKKRDANKRARVKK